MAAGRLLWLAWQSGTLSRTICRIHTLLQTTSNTCRKHFWCQRTSAITPLDVLWQYTLQINILLTYLHRNDSNTLTLLPSCTGTRCHTHRDGQAELARVACYIPRRFTHLSTNRATGTATTFIRTNTQSLSESLTVRSKGRGPYSFLWGTHLPLKGHEPGDRDKTIMVTYLPSRKHQCPQASCKLHYAAWWQEGV